MQYHDPTVVMKNYIDIVVDEIIIAKPSRFGGMFRVRFDIRRLYEYFDEHMHEDVEDDDIWSYINNYTLKYRQTTINHIVNVTHINY